MERSTSRDLAQRIFAAGVAAADPRRATRAALRREPIAVRAGGRVIVLALGKAAIGMAEAARAALREGSGGEMVPEGLIVTNRENARPLSWARVFAAGHPVPDAAGAHAARAVEALVDGAGAHDLVLVLVSGGGSALLPAPVAGISLADLVETNRLLLGAGVDITGINLVRQQLSRLAGGGLARRAAPAQVRALILSDVIGDDLRVVASGPTVAPVGSRAEALALLHTLGIHDALPAAVRRHLGAAQAPVPPLPAVRNMLIGSNAISVAAMRDAALAAGVGPVCVASAPLLGDVATASGVVLEALRAGPGVWLAGGETTVRLARTHGEGAGLGGRNQELALRLALAAEGRGLGRWVFLSGGTDGRDGPTDAAGGLVDGTTVARIVAAGGDPRAALSRNDSYHALDLAGDLLRIGATGTNVADLQVLIRVG